MDCIPEKVSFVVTTSRRSTDLPSPAKIAAALSSVTRVVAAFVLACTR